ncbi:MAG: ribbon-helix-helix protein, CopG family [Pseudonocardiaceae bacterium]|nr:ribbon-helix-helix protein, CopG family [Pseudonocardiaceae bacterium]
MNHRHQVGPDVDLEAEDVRDRQGRRITTEYAGGAADEALQFARPGRPSLGAIGQVSPRVSFRIPEQTRRRAEERASAEGRSVSEVAREALERYLDGTG